MTTCTSATAHPAAAACYVCDDSPEYHGPGGITGHRFWASAEVLAEIRATDRRMKIRYSDGTTDPAAHYVAEHRPY